MDGLKWLAENHECVYRLARWVSKRYPNNVELADILMEEAYDRITRLVELYQPNHASGATFKTYALRQLRWYWGKTLKRRASTDIEFIEEEHPNEESLNREVADQVNILIEKAQLNEYEILILKMKWCQGYSLRGIARLMGVSHCTIVRDHQKIMKRLRDV